MVYAADGAEFVLFFLGFDFFKFLVVDVGKAELAALHFGYAHVAIFLFFGVDIV